MNDTAGVFRQFLYIRGGGVGRIIATEYLQALHDFCMRQTGSVRWMVATRDTLSKQVVLESSLIVIDWEDASDLGEQIFKDIRDWEYVPDDQSAIRPIIILRSASARPTVEESFARKHPGAVVVEPSDVRYPARIADAIRTLGVDMPKRSVLDLVGDVIEPGIRTIIQDVGSEQFDLVLQKYFPYENKPRLFPVEGGWSGDPLVRVRARMISGEPKEFFLKFFTTSDKFINEIGKHEKAYEWLRSKGAGIPLHRIPHLGETAIEQLKAFPSFGTRPVFPVCYISASAETGHKTFKDLFYQSRRASDPHRALRRILAILNAEDDIRLARDQAPFAIAGETGPLVLSDARRASILRTLAELDRYGESACGGEWINTRSCLELFVYKPLGGELVKPRSVAVGPIHGDANPRNCLVNPDNLDDVLLIDCGDYDAHGRLVYDLALMERDIILVLMANETRSRNQFYDLDSHCLSEWCTAQRASIEKGLDYSLREVVKLKSACPSAYVAHTLVVEIRRQAKALRGHNDPDGRHYFAALLYWMIKGLDERAIPATKKVLALYSMSQILRVLF